jgi:hypothetical protein
MITMMHQKDPNASMDPVAEFANDDYAICWYHMKGTSDGSMGMPAGPYDMHSIEVVKFNADSKATEHWSYMAMDEMAKMMGKPTENNMNNNMGGKDTTSHM